VVRPSTVGEEIANSVTHGLGTALGVAALVLLVTAASRGGGGAVRLAAAVVFGATLVLLYAASTLYHALPQPRAKHVFKVLDHAAIYLLIAGTYTPLLLITLRDSGGATLLWIQWGLAAAGVSAEAFWTYRPRWLSVAVYLAMGWLAIVRVEVIAAEMSAPGFRWLVAGGLAYTLGTIFYVVKRVPYFHAVWHLFVLAGSACHFVVVWRYVL
jgi:hemolysin III